MINLKHHLNIYMIFFNQEECYLKISAQSDCHFLSTRVTNTITALVRILFLFNYNAWKVIFVCNSATLIHRYVSY